MVEEVGSGGPRKVRKRSQSGGGLMELRKTDSQRSHEGQGAVGGERATI